VAPVCNRCVGLPSCGLVAYTVRHVRQTSVEESRARRVAFDCNCDALREIDGFFRKSGNVIIALTLREILDEEIARKLA